MAGMDKSIRLMIALAVVILAYSKVIQGTLALVLMIIAAVLVITSMFSFCPLYLLFGINTLKKKE